MNRAQVLLAAVDLRLDPASFSRLLITSSTARPPRGGCRARAHGLGSTRMAQRFSGTERQVLELLEQAVQPSRLAIGA